MNFFHQIAAIIIKDFRIEIKTKEILSSMLLFALLTVVMMGFAFNIRQEIIEEVLPGLIWIIFLFAGVLGLNKSFINERKNDCLDGISLAAGNPIIIFIAKVISNFIFLLITEAIILPIFFILFNIDAPQSLGMLIFIIFLGAFGFASIGTFLAALTAHTRNSAMFLPIILFPLLVPLFLGLLQVTKGLLSGVLVSHWSLWLKVVVVFDLVYLVVPILLFDYLLEV